MSERRILGIVGGALLVSVLVAYIETMGGSTSFWDCGEFIATAYILGIPHPPATPLYVVLGRVFTELPLPLSVAQKVNFMSALFGALGVVVLFFLIVDLIRERRGPVRSNLDRIVVYGCALAGALFTAWSNTYWTNAIEAEVYAISSFVMGLTTLLARQWARKPDDPHSTGDIYLIIYLLSLGVGFHLGTVLTYPAIALYCLLFRKKSFKDADLVVFSFGFFLFLAHVNLAFKGSGAVIALLLFLVAFGWRSASGSRFVPIATGLFLLGLSIHLFLLIRSAQNPGIDEANPANWHNLLAVLRREQYPPGNLFVRKASWHFQIVDHFWRYFREQYELVAPGPGGAGRRLALVPIFIGLVGLVSLARRDLRTFLLIFVTLAICSLGLIVFLNFSATEVRERDYFYSPAFYFFGVCIGVGAAALLDWFFGSRPSERRSRFDAIGSVVGVVLLLGMTGMLYNRYHFEHDRTRERIPWGYGYNMLAGLEPNALIFTNGDNDTFPLWYQQEVEHFRTDVRVLNISLLNTGWYIEQLKENDPKVTINLPEDFIREPHGAYDKDGRVLQPRDIAMRQIVRDNFGKRPIYFAVTIPHENMADFEDYLVLEGLVKRFVGTKSGPREDWAKIEHNVTQVYDYAGILTPDGKHDDTIYRDTNQRLLINNYASSFIRLGQKAEQEGDRTVDKAARDTKYDEAIHWYQGALAVSPELDVVQGLMGTLYIKTERMDEALEMFKDLSDRDPQDDRWRFRLAGALLLAGRADDGVRELRQVAEKAPEDVYVMETLIQALYETGRTEEADNELRIWESRHPGDRTLRDFYDALRGGLVDPIVGPPPDSVTPPGVAPAESVH